MWDSFMNPASWISKIVSAFVDYSGYPAKLLFSYKENRLSTFTFQESDGQVSSLGVTWGSDNNISYMRGDSFDGGFSFDYDKVKNNINIDLWKYVINNILDIYGLTFVSAFSDISGERCNNLPRLIRVANGLIGVKYGQFRLEYTNNNDLVTKIRISSEGDDFIWQGKLLDYDIIYEAY